MDEEKLPDGVYRVGNPPKQEDKYKNDKYEKSKYISKGYILPDGTMLTKKYAKYHTEMAKRYIAENYAKEYENGIISDPRDFMVMVVGAVQVLSSGQPVIMFSDEWHNKVIQDAIASYLMHGWRLDIVENPYKSHLDYLRNHVVNGDVYLDRKLAEIKAQDEEKQNQ